MENLVLLRTVTDNYSTISPAGPVLRTFVQTLIAFCSRPEAAGDVISDRFLGPIVPDRQVKFGVHHTNGSREMQPKAVRGSIFDGL